MKTTRSEMVVAALVSGAGYNVVELTLIAIVSGVHLAGSNVPSLFLWLMFSAAALWTVVASTRDAQDEAQHMVRYREVYITDFLLGAFMLLALSIMTMRYGVQFGAIFFVAAIQNLRYSALAYGWLQEERRDKNNSKRDNLPPV